MVSHVSSRRALVVFLALILISAAAIVTCAMLAQSAKAQPATATISGRVTGQMLGDPIQGCTVQAIRTIDQVVEESDNTDVNGDYSVDVPSGDYKIYFIPGDVAHINTYYHDQYTWETADVLTVVAGNSYPGIDQILADALVTGRVTAFESGDPLVGAVVEARHSILPAVIIDSTTTDINGDYQFLLPTLDYKFRFNPDDGLHAIMFYNNKTAYVEADILVVSVGNRYDNIDQACPIGGSLSGHVRDGSTHADLPGVEVVLYTVSYDMHLRRVTELRSEWTDATGYYLFEGLPAASYCIKALSADAWHVTEWWYNAKSGSETADAVTVDADETVTDIDLYPPSGGSLSGQVLDTVGDPVVGCTVRAYYYVQSQQNWVVQQEAATSDTGAFIVGPMPEGTYRIEFFPDPLEDPVRHAAEWWNDKLDLASADNVTVVTCQVTPLDPELDPIILKRCGTIFGKVVTDDSVLGPIENVTVKAWYQYGATWVLVSSDITLGADGNPNSPQWGTYRLAGLPPGTYAIQFIPNRAEFWLGEFYNDRQSIGTADLITLAEEEQRGNVNVGLTWNQTAPYGVMPFEFSNYGSTLGACGYEFENLDLVSDGAQLSESYDAINLAMLKHFNAVFLNCASTFTEIYPVMRTAYFLPEESPLHYYVAQGGRLFVDDIAGEIVMDDFRLGGGQLPVTFASPVEQGQKQTVLATIVDQSMVSYMGTTAMGITYDKDGTVVLTAADPSCTQYMRANIVTDHLGTFPLSPICLTAPFVNGKIYFQNFHIDMQPLETAQKLMFFFVGQGAPRPEISGVDPTSGVAGTSVTIAGTGFGATRGSSYVTFNGKAVTIYELWAENQIVCQVPSGATTGPLKVVTPGGTSNAVTFNVLNPANASAWYLAEGCSAWGFETYVTMENPNPDAVTAQVTYMTPEGEMPRPDIVLLPYSQTTINPRNDIGSKDFSTSVICKENKQIAVDRRMIWTGEGAPSPEGHCSIGVTAPSTAWYLAEGSAQWGFETWILVQNPNSAAATLTVTYMIDGGGTETATKSVPPSSRLTWNMGTDIGPKDASIRIVSDRQVIAERAMYRNNKKEGHESIGTTAAATDYFLAEGTTAWGFTTYILVQNPNLQPVVVYLSYMTTGGRIDQAPIEIPSEARKTIRVNDVEGMANQDFSTQVTGSLPIIAERAMYWGEGTALGESCHDSVGMSEPHTVFYLPDGETQNGHETWTCVQNPNATEVTVAVEYLSPEGGPAGVSSFSDTIGANSRKTYNMAEKIPSGRAAIRVYSLTPGKKIMVERAMYWNNRGAGAETIGGFSD